MNFVIFMPDEMRAESVGGAYGHPLTQTPNIDRLAADGTTFTQCYVQHTVCGPSRCSMFTGWYPHVSGHRTLWHLLRPHEPNTLKYFKRAGYDVRWYGKNDLLAAESFPDSVTEARPPKGGKSGPRICDDPADPRYDSFLYGPYDCDPMATRDANSVTAGIEFLQSPAADKPFVLYLPLSFPHPPFSAPEPYYSMYSPDDVPPLRPAGLPGKPSFHELIRQTRRLDKMDEADYRRIAAVYLGMVSYSDFLLGQVLDALDATGRADDTTVIFTADHGDWAGEYGLVEKWPSALDDTVARVPLVIRTPGGTRGHVVDTPVEVFDISATMHDLGGVPIGHTQFARSLAPQLAGQPGDADRCAYAEGGYDLHELHATEAHLLAELKPKDIYYQKVKLQETHPASACRTLMIRTATHKLIFRTNDTCELYDMTADPRELDNLYGRPEVAGLQQELETRLLRFMVETSDVVPFERDGRAGEYIDPALRAEREQ